MTLKLELRAHPTENHRMTSSSKLSGTRGSGIASSLAFALFTGVIGLTPGGANAALGEPEAAIAADVPSADGTLPAATIRSIERGVYRIHEIRLPSGTRVREFAPPGGSVFAVTWTGPAMPDLRQTLGRYFTAYAAAPRPNPISRTHFQWRENGLVVESSGHMRAFTGRAYLETSLPAGVSVEDLR
jgi:hypothetical protein